ncbi:MAG: ribbon-helix-helix protein, CopG family [Bacteroidales bacterium]|nr:ribbon-helix-helix protein, CopG family [Bacteroidales bacterium]
MEQVKGYKAKFEIKEKNLYCRMDSSMIERLKEIRRASGISCSETVREAVRRLFNEIDQSGNITLKI